MNRRDYLKSLLALGASFTLPAVGSFPTAQASSALIDALDDQYVDSIWEEGIDLFEVTDSGTISFADFQEPQTRGDVYCLEVRDLDDVDALIDFGQRSPLGYKLQSVYDEYRGALEAELANGLTSERRRLKKRLSRLPDDPDGGWVAWLEAEPKEAREAYANTIETFLADPPDWGNEYDWMPDDANAQGAAYQYFIREDIELLDTLGVVVVEGDCPGSSYFAAELRVPVEAANEAAQAAGIPIRFRKGA